MKCIFSHALVDNILIFALTFIHLDALIKTMPQSVSLSIVLAANLANKGHLGFWHVEKEVSERAREEMAMAIEKTEKMRERVTRREAETRRKRRRTRV